MSTDPSRIVLGREQPGRLPTAPPLPPPPPAPPEDPDWFRPGSGSSGQPPSIEIHHHYYAAEPAGGSLSVPDPEPGPRWWQRRRPGYTAACLLIAWFLSTPWAAVLADVRDTESLAGAWVMAIGPLIVLAFADNVYRVAAAGAADELWLPKIRAACARTLLLTAAIATARTLPLTTLVYAVTGVKP
jgi:hypothetical protein